MASAASSGYSGAPLYKKLGIKEGATVLVFNPPDTFPSALTEVPFDFTLIPSATEPFSVDVILLFVRSYVELGASFSQMHPLLSHNGGLWVCWPKKSSGIESDLSQSAVQEHGLAHGLVDNKICSIDDTWSSLRFVYRLKDRES